MYVLDNLHEDLSRVKEKPYIEINEKELNETEDSASKRWWINHLKRENSIIVDLFHGQYRSEIYCSQCGKISITFDPYVFLGLPIPNSNYSAKFKLFIENPFKNMILIDFKFSEQSTVKDLKECITSQNKLKKVNLLILLTKQFYFKQVLKDNEVLLPFLERNDFEIICWETNYSIEDHENKLFMVSPTEIFEETSYFIMKNEIRKPFFYPKPFVISKDLKIIDLYFEIFKYYRKILNDIGKNREVDKFEANFEKNDDYLEEEYNLYQSNMSNMFKLFIFNNMSESSSIFDNKICEFCGKNCELCEFKFDQGLDIEKVCQKLKNRKYFILLIQFPIKNPAPLFELPNISYTLNKKNNFSIYDCLHTFGVGEKLEKDNAWFCNGCKKHQECTKKMDIYRTPQILIIQLKRFKMNNSNFNSIIHNQKNDALIDYPLDNLDLKEYVVDKNFNHLYDLYAISVHNGSISSGHYTAICKNRENWYLFDDSKIYKIPINQVVTESAYLLFYKRKNG